MHMLPMHTHTWYMTLHAHAYSSNKRKQHIAWYIHIAFTVFTSFRLVSSFFTSACRVAYITVPCNTTWLRTCTIRHHAWCLYALTTQNVHNTSLNMMQDHTCTFAAVAVLATFFSGSASLYQGRTCIPCMSHGAVNGSTCLQTHDMLYTHWQSCICAFNCMRHTCCKHHEAQSSWRPWSSLQRACTTNTNAVWNVHTHQEHMHELYTSSNHITCVHYRAPKLQTVLIYARVSIMSEFMHATWQWLELLPPPAQPHLRLPWHESNTHVCNNWTKNT